MVELAETLVATTLEDDGAVGVDTPFAGVEDVDEDDALPVGVGAEEVGVGTTVTGVGDGVGADGVGVGVG